MLSQFIFRDKEAKMAHIKGLISLPSIKAVPYDISEQYERLDYIEHPEYGLGFVDEIISDNSMVVFFLEGPEREIPQRII